MERILEEWFAGLPALVTSRALAEHHTTAAMDTAELRSANPWIRSNRVESSFETMGKKYPAFQQASNEYQQWQKTAPGDAELAAFSTGQLLEVAVLFHWKFLNLYRLQVSSREENLLLQDLQNQIRFTLRKSCLMEAIYIVAMALQSLNIMTFFII